MLGCCRLLRGCSTGWAIQNKRRASESKRLGCKGCVAILSRFRGKAGRVASCCPSSIRFDRDVIAMPESWCTLQSTKVRAEHDRSGHAERHALHLVWKKIGLLMSSSEAVIELQTNNYCFVMCIVSGVQTHARGPCIEVVTSSRSGSLAEGEKEFKLQLRAFETSSAVSGKLMSKLAGRKQLVQARLLIDAKGHPAGAVDQTSEGAQWDSVVVPAEQTRSRERFSMTGLGSQVLRHRAVIRKIMCLGGIPSFRTLKTNTRCRL